MCVYMWILIASLNAYCCSLCTNPLLSPSTYVHTYSRHLIFSELKTELWESALEATSSDNNASMELLLSRSLAARHRATGRPDVEAKYTIFSQVGR